MPVKYALYLLVLFTACQPKSKKVMTTDKTNPFYLGTYTEGESEGIYKYELSADGTIRQVALVAKSENPSFLAKSKDGEYLVAVNEIQNDENVGSVESWKIGADSLTLISRCSSGGAHPCHVAINAAGYVLTSNYTGGNVGLLKLSQSDGQLQELDVQQHAGQGTSDRQQGPHAHSAWFVPACNDVIAVDLGTNDLWLSILDPIKNQLMPADPLQLSMAEGAGPRHLTFHPTQKWLYVVNELDCTVTLIQKDAAGHYQMGNSITTLPQGYDQPNSCADIHISADGRFLYASNRGHNSIAIFAVNPEDGALTAVGHTSTHGDGPRNFALSPDGKYLLVANQHTQNIVSFKRDETTGLLTFVNEAKAPTPVCILF